MRQETKDIETNKNLYDTSDYPKEHQLHSNANKKVLGKMKDECAGKLIAECVSEADNALYLEGRQKKIKKAKGVKKSIVKKQIMHEQNKETLFGMEQSWNGMNILRSEGHEIYGMHVNKIFLSPFDSKRWIADDGIHTNAYGYTRHLLTDTEIKEIEALLTDAEMKEMLELLGGVIVFLEGQPAVPHAQSRAWGRRANSRERAHWV